MKIRPYHVPEALGLMSALGFLVTVVADIFWVVPLFYLLILACCCIALSIEEEF